MPTQSRKSGFPEFFTDAKSAENVRRQFLEMPLEAARQAALGPASELGQLLSLLPNAFAASQRRELKRVRDSAEENDARVAALEASIKEADALRRMARRGEVRVKRSLVALAGDRDVFHGFLSDSDLNPLEGLTVRVTSGKARDSRALSAESDSDGYFSIPLGRKAYTKTKTEADSVNATSDLFGELFARRESASAAQEPPAGASEESRVEILKKGEILHEDPVPIGLDVGSIYREYVVSKKASASDLWEFMSNAESRVRAATGAAETAPARTSRRDASASPASRRKPKKSSSRGVKSPKRKNK